MAATLHVMMLPWSAFGHLMPFFQLSVALAKSGVKVSFISTPRNFERLPKPPPNVAALINFVEFPLPVLDNHDQLLPEGAEATVDIPFDKIQYLKIAYDLLQRPVKQFVEEESPDWIICDFSAHWAANIAKEYQVPLLNFSVFSASTYTFLGPELLAVDENTKIRQTPESLAVVPEWVDFPSLLAFRSFEAIGFYAGFYGSNASGITDLQRSVNVIVGSAAIAIRSCPEYEGEYLNLLEKILGKPVIPVGLLPPEKAKGRDQITTDESWSKIFKWLDERTAKSVLFVGFGSECKLSKDQVYEIAHGLELSGLPFLWALQKPKWATDDVDALPSGFNDKIHGRGMVCIGWVPQLEILGHPSIGGSLFHSGWGSVIETLQCGHTLVVLPFIIDQPLNARVLVEKGLALEVERSEDGSFTRYDIANALKLAMVSEEGEKLRVKATETGKIFNDRKLHDGYLDNFVDYLKRNVVNKRE